MFKVAGNSFRLYVKSGIKNEKNSITLHRVLKQRVYSLLLVRALKILTGFDRFLSVHSSSKCAKV